MVVSDLRVNCELVADSHQIKFGSHSLPDFSKMNCVIRINEHPNGLKDSQSKKKNPVLAEFKTPLSAVWNGYGFADENNIRIHPGFQKSARECGN